MMIESEVTFTASINRTILRVTGITGGTLKIGHIVTGASVAQGTVITGQTRGLPGGRGDYVVNIAQTIVSETMSANKSCIITTGIKSGATLKRLRKYHKLTQVEFAKLSGVSVRTISTIEVYGARISTKYEAAFLAVFKSLG
jgi:DNA-binding XRE family transcriptional regulator